MRDRSIRVVVEGTTDAAVTRRLLQDAGLDAGPEYVMGGKDALDPRLGGYNSAARFSCWLVLRDLDRDEACPAALRTRLLPRPSRHMRLHVAVRAVEAWLLGDAARIAAALGVRKGAVATEPDALADPKRHLLDLARSSRRRAIREEMLPAPGTTARVGPGYTATLIEFAAVAWRPAVAETRSPSLARLRAFLRRAGEGGSASA